MKRILLLICLVTAGCIKHATMYLITDPLGPGESSLDEARFCHNAVVTFMETEHVTLWPEEARRLVLLCKMGHTAGRVIGRTDVRNPNRT